MSISTSETTVAILPWVRSRSATSSAKLSSNAHFLRLIVMKFFALVAALLVAQSASSQDAVNWAGRVEAEFKQKNWPAALQLADKGNAAEPKNPQLLFYRGRIYEETGQHKKAIADFDQSILIQPAMPAVYQHRGSEHFKLGQIRESLADFDIYVKREPDREPYHWQQIGRASCRERV